MSWGAVYYLATWLGTLTLVQGGLLTLASPAAGVAALWFVFGGPRTWVWDAAALVVCTVITNVRLDAPALLVVTSPVVSLLQVGSFVLALRTLAPGLEVNGSRTRTLRALRDLAGFLVAAAVAGTVSAIGTNLTQAAAGLSTGDPRFLLIRWGRNTSTIVVVGAVGLILGPSLYRALRRRDLPEVLRRTLHQATPRLVEGLALTISSIVLYVVCFRVSDGYPVAFLLFVTTAWVGLRFSPGVIALHSLLTGTLAVAFTVAGDGVFGQLDDQVLGAALVQLFVLVTTCTGLVLGLSREATTAAERTASVQAQTLDSVLSEVDDGILLMDDAGAILMINQAGRRLLDMPGSPADRAELTAGATLFHPAGLERRGEDSIWRRALAGEEVRDEEIEVRTDDGEVRRVLRVSARLLPSDGGEKRVLVGYHDVTADRRQREALVKYAGEVSHDLRNPLTVVSGWTDALLEEFESGAVTSDVGAPMARRVQAAATYMQDFIANMLDFTVARDQELKPVDLDIASVASAVATLRIDGASEGEPPRITVEGRERGWADPLLVRVLLDNLVGNAVKYVAPGVRPEIEVVVGLLDQDWVQVEVCDNGIGISREERDQIFESFSRVEQEGYQGTGLGLAICQRIVQRHGGTISVDARPAGGTVFSFTLPRTQAAYDGRSQA